MIKLKNSLKNVCKGLIISSLITGGLLLVEETNKKPSHASPGFLEFQWDPDPNFVRLKSFQTSNERLDRSTYYFFLRPGERKTGILKLSVKVPDYFEATIKPEKVSLCEAKIGGWETRTKCLAQIPAVVEISENQKTIDIFPDLPLPVDQKTYAVAMKIWNPRKRGMFQFHAYAQSPGAMPISSYVGTWTLDVE